MINFDNYGWRNENLELSLSLIVDDEATRRVTSDAIDEIVPRPTSSHQIGYYNSIQFNSIQFNSIQFSTMSIE